MGSVRRVISIIKKRTGCHEKTIREFEISFGGISVGDPLVAFHGVLQGVPDYRGESGPLISDQKG